jgi:hypothetical protein
VLALLVESLFCTLLTSQHKSGLGGQPSFGVSAKEGGPSFGVSAKGGPLLELTKKHGIVSTPFCWAKLILI